MVHTRWWLLFLLMMTALHVRAQSVERLLDLSGTWRFEAGDDMRWAAAAFDDRAWDSIHVPGAWEDQGYPGYDGYAWYRKHFTAPRDIQERYLLLRLGTIDDVDEAYVNGRFIGFGGQFPPSYETDYNAQREYAIPSWLLKPEGDNVIAIRVYDDHLDGGVTGGSIGLYADHSVPHPDLSFDGMWKFRTGDSLEWSKPDYPDAAWKGAYVPAFWETQGYKGFDGAGWYRFHFTVPDRLASGRLLVLLGKIDDIDEAYLNGQRIGRTGNFDGDMYPHRFGNEYEELRAYTVPVGLLRQGGENVLAVRVYDGWRHGGIYRGPVGLITRDGYNAWRRSHPPSRTVFDSFWDFFSH